VPAPPPSPARARDRSAARESWSWWPRRSASAGLPGPDPGDAIAVDKPPHAKVLAAGRPTALWHVAGTPDDRAVFVGEARGLWLWAVAWPEGSGLLLYDELVLTDLRDAGAEIELLPCGAISPRLLGP
jgi:hypothetical protein